MLPNPSKRSRNPGCAQEEKGCAPATLSISDRSAVFHSLALALDQPDWHDLPQHT
jgi:hypothetical protein